MRLFDSHCHFTSCRREEIAPLLERAREAGVAKILAVGGSAELDAAALAAAGVAEGDPALPEVVVACGRDRDQIGAAPCAVETRRLSAWGEIGLDYFYSPGTRRAQLGHFLAQLEHASEAGLPVIIHTREADDDTLGALREVPSRGIIHCFTGSPAYCRKLLDLGFFVSISGIVTFRNADNVRESALVIPDDRLLIETDSPFLAPVPMRGRANEPAFVAHTLRFLANIRGTAEDRLAEMTFSNADSALR
ncbi:MAG: TatD family hydrolase [Kiritimatiellae bacterium]|nr:TatD family hydrolase [Kiritimatiellia bacterium]